MRLHPLIPILSLGILGLVVQPGHLCAQADSTPDSLAQPAEGVDSLDVQVPGSFTSHSLRKTVRYLVDLPKGYASHEANRFPLLVFLHGIGERGGGAQLSRLNKWGLPKLAHKGARFPMIVVAPQLPGNQKRWPVPFIGEVITAVSAAYRVDSTRIYLTGLSTGAEGAWAYALARPQAIAAIVPIAGTGTLADICAMREVAVWAFNGELDKDEPPSRQQQLVDAINACQPPPIEPARLTIYPGAGHEVWSRTYDGSAGNDIFAWLLTHHR